MRRTLTSQMNMVSDRALSVEVLPPGSEKVRIATLAVVAAAMVCGLSLRQAQELAAAQIEVAAAIVAHPERRERLMRKAALATEAVVVLFRGPRSASASWGSKSVRTSRRAA